MIYLLVIFLIVTGSFCFDFSEKHKKYSNSYYVFSIFILILVAGLRYRVGSDTFVYQQFFEKIPSSLSFDFNSILKQPFEPGWVVLNFILKLSGASFYLLQLIHSLFINSVFGVLIWKTTKYRFLSLLFYVIILYPNYNFEILRQSVSIALFVIGYFKLAKKKYLSYYFLTLIAFLFHYSAFILFFIPLIIIFSKRLIFSPIKLLFISIGIYIASLVAAVTIADYIRLLPVMEDKTFVYFANAEDSTFKISTIFNLILNVGLPIYIIKYLGREIEFINNKKRKQYMYLTLSLCCFSVIFYCLSATLPIFYRLYWYFLSFGILLYPYLIDILHSIGFNKKIGILVIYILLVIKGRVYFSKDEFNVIAYEKYYPYSSVFYEFKDKKREQHFGIN